MRIENVRIKNFRSLLDVPFEDLGNLTVLIGENGSGKSNIVEALNLFFMDFSVIGGAPSPTLTKAVAWHGKRPKKPIEISLTIQLEEDEFGGILEENEILTKRMKEKYGEGYRNITVSRLIVKPGAQWITKHLKLGGLVLVKDDILSTSDQLDKALRPPSKKRKRVGRIKAYFFHPKAEKPDFAKPRLIVLGKMAYRMGAFADSLVRDNRVGFEIVSGIDYRTWVGKEKLTLVQASPSPSVLNTYLSKGPPPPPLFTDKNLNSLIGNIQTLLKEGFKLVPANRNVKAEIGSRKPFVDKAEVIDPFCNLNDSSDPDEEELLADLKQKIRSFTLHDLELLGEKMFVWEQGLRIPVESIGGGQQEIISLMWHVYSTPEGSIVAIEEPENHLHEKYMRQLFKFVKEGTGERQTWFITHSFVFVDQADLRNNWKVWKKGRQTMVKRVESKGDLEEILDTMGARPTDRLFPNRVFLACKTEREFFSTLAKGMGHELEGVATLLGSDLDKRKIQMSWEFVRNTQTSLIVVVDEHGKEVGELAKKEKWVAEDNCFVLEGTIEDYYPRDILTKAIKKLFDQVVKKETLEKPTVEAIQAIKGVPKGWKIPLAEEVAEQWAKKPSTIDPYVFKILQKIVRSS